MLDDPATDRLRAQLVRHDGCQRHIYRSPAGQWSIGVGRNLEDKGISMVEAFMLLDHDIQDAESALVRLYPACYLHLDATRAAALVNVMIHVGALRFGDFPEVIAECAAGDYDRAAAAMLGSKWPTPVGARARELAAQIRTGAWR